MPADITPFAGPVWVTLATVLLYYGLIVRVAVVKARRAAEHHRRGETFDRYFGQDREMLAADRAHLNMLEQLPLFVMLLWLNAVFVGTTSTTAAGTVWLVSRAAYPLLMGDRLGRGIRASLLLSTLPGYLVIAWYAGALFVVALR